MPELPWQSTEDENKKLREVPLLEYIFYERPESMLTDYPPQEGPQNIPSTNAIKIMRHCDQKLSGSYCLRPGKAVGDAALAPECPWG